MGPLAAIGAVGTGLNAIGNFFGQQGTNKENKRQFNLTYGLQKKNVAQGLQGALDSAPLRDRLMFNMRMRAGLPTREFRPSDPFNPGAGAPQAGGVDRAALEGLMGQYKAGAGGINTELLKRMLGELGYGPPRPPQYNIIGMARRIIDGATKGY